MVQLSSIPSGPGHNPPGGTRIPGPVAGLERRRREAGPLITWYRGSDRVELSGRTVGSWVAKTVHLLASEGIQAGDRVGLVLLSRHRLHWAALTWLLSCWWAGVLPVVRAEPSEPTTDLEVSGPDPAGSDPRVPLVQCSLAPLGGPCRNPAPGAIDFSDALAMPDEMPAPAPSPTTAPRMLGMARLDESDLACAPAVDDRLLISGELEPGELALLLAGCLAGTGSLILLEELPEGMTAEGLAGQEGARIVA